MPFELEVTALKDADTCARGEAFEQVKGKGQDSQEQKNDGNGLEVAAPAELWCGRQLVESLGGSTGRSAEGFVGHVSGGGQACAGRRLSENGLGRASCVGEGLGREGISQVV